MAVTMKKLSWSGDRGEVWADTLENLADALGEAGEVFSWLPFSKIKDTAGRQTEFSINLCYKWIYHQVAEYAEIAAELAAAALPWLNPQEFCSKKKDCVISRFVSVGCSSVILDPQNMLKNWKKIHGVLKGTFFLANFLRPCSKLNQYFFEWRGERGDCLKNLTICWWDLPTCPGSVSPR